MNNISPVTTQSKTSLLSQVDALRDVARRVRRLSKTIARESDQRRLTRHAEELDETATRLEAEAAGVKV